MKGSATIIGGISGRAIVCQPCQGTSAARGQVHGSGLPRTCPLAAASERTRESGLLSWIRVLPEQPQELVWLTPQVGIDYTIKTSTELEWQIK
jgi:hypothetical protein